MMVKIENLTGKEISELDDNTFKLTAIIYNTGSRDYTAHQVLQISAWTEDNPSRCSKDMRQKTFLAFLKDAERTMAVYTPKDKSIDAFGTALAWQSYIHKIIIENK